LAILVASAAQSRTLPGFGDRLDFRKSLFVEVEPSC
jgi:hypothetical protein